MEKVTISDVAKKAGVSKTIVSFVLNDVKGRYSEESKKKVLKAVKELDFVPNTAAKNLASSKNNAVTLVYSKEFLKDPNASTNQFIIEAIKYTEQEGLVLSIKTTKRWKSVDEAVNEYLSIWYSQQSNGIIFYPAYGEMDEEIFERLYKEHKVNIAVVSTVGENGGYPTVSMDGYLHMWQALDYIVKHDYDRIYYIHQKYTGKPHGRVKAYADYLNSGKAKGEFLEYKDEYRNKDELWQLIKPVIEKHNENIAFACWNDVDAVNVLELLNLYKVKSNYKIGVMGFDDMRLSAHTFPALTTVHYPFDESAKKAISIIVDNEVNVDRPPHYSVYGKIMERESI